MSQRYVPVVSSSGKPLMPTTNWRADELIAKGKALRRFKAGIFYIKLTQRADGVTQPIGVGVDPGSKREAFTVKSESHTYLNVLSDAVTYVKEAVKIRREMRRGRRFRNTPYRKCRSNKGIGDKKLAPSTRARWNAKLRILFILALLFPITCVIVEDIKACTHKGSKRWNQSFSPLENGKNYFYNEIKKHWLLETKRGYETKELRDSMGLKKLSNKMSEKFNSHNVDSWVLANWYVGGHSAPDNKEIHRLIPIRFYRRQLHKLQPAKDGIRKRQGGTISLGLKRGSLIKHPKYGVCYLGGYSDNQLSVHSLKSGRRLSHRIHKENIQLLSFNYWRYK